MSKQPDKAREAASEISLNKAYLALAQDWSLWEAALHTALEHITESVSGSLHAQRVGIWLAECRGYCAGSARSVRQQEQRPQQRRQHSVG